MGKPTVLVFVEHYLPGFQAGGPIRSISGLVRQLGDVFDFRIVTRDRDDGIDRPYPDIHPPQWQQVGEAMVRYLRPSEVMTRTLVAIAHEMRPGAIYLNGTFGPMAVRILMARRVGRLRSIPLVIAPRGELCPGALKLKQLKKTCFLKASAAIGLYRGVLFQATSEQERRDIVGAIGRTIVARVAGNPVQIDSPPCARKCEKVKGLGRFVFISRISRKKNLHLAIQMLQSLTGGIAFDIYGPLASDGDRTYWEECLAAISRLPANVAVTYRGPIPHQEVATTLSGYDFFLFPTESENFAHAVVEALVAGCPVVISDQTPWTGLAARGAGWDLPLADRECWMRTLQACVEMDETTHRLRRADAASLGRQIACADETRAQNLELFRSVIRPS